MAQEKTLIVPDKDADGLDAGVIIYRTLTALGHSPSLIDVHLLPKGYNIHDEQERAAMKAKQPRFVIVVDQGSRRGPPVIDSEQTESLIIDHHLSDEFPENALVSTAGERLGGGSYLFAYYDQVVSACHYPPVATSALLTYEICRPLHPDVANTCSYLCVMGTHGDLGTSLKWKPPFPDMTETFRLYSKKAINDAVALINARKPPILSIRITRKI